MTSSSSGTQQTIELDDEIPLAVEDDVYSLEPITDRNVVVDIFKLLSAKTYRSLQEDSRENERYARRMVISNQIIQKRSGTPRSRNPRRRDEIDVTLPINYCCWNDLDAIDIQLQMLYTIQGEEFEDYPWFNVRIHLDNFIDPLTRQVFVNDGHMVTEIH